MAAYVLLMTSDALSSGLCTFQISVYVQYSPFPFFCKAERGLLDQTSAIPNALGCYDIRCVHSVNDYGLNALYLEV